MAQNIFISYRRKDTRNVAKRLKAKLDNHFVTFLDERDITGGDDWKIKLESEIEKATIVLVLIGEQWNIERLQV